MGQHEGSSALIGIDCQVRRCGFGSPDDESEALSLEYDVRWIDHHMKQLQQRKLDKLRRMNTLRPATRNLPPETLLLIFHHVATPITCSTFLDCHRRYRKDMDRNISIIRCASVSSLWRDLILATPSLWTTLVLNLRPNASQVEKELMELFWMRSQQLPLAVDLGFVGSQHSGGPAWEDKARELFTLVSKKVDRLTMLRLHNPPTSLVHHITTPLVRHITTSSPLRQLQCLSLESMNKTDLPRTTFILSNLPQLRRLTLRSIRCRIRVPQHNSISVLDLFEASLDVCIMILKCCPNVVEVRCLSPIAPRDARDIGSGSTRILTFPFLQNFTWTLSCNNSNASFIQRLALPALKTLQLYDDVDHTRSISPQSVIRFFHQLSPGLQGLELVKWREWTSGGLGQLFYRVQNTRKLVLRDCFETFNLDMITLLNLTQTGSAHQPEYLPHLAVLSIQSDKTRSYLEILPDLIKQRALRSSGIEPFRLEISRPEVSVAQSLEAEAAAQNGCIDLKFLEKFGV